MLQLRRYEWISVRTGRFRSNAGHLIQNFTSKPINHSSSQKTRLNDLSHKNLDRSFFRFVTNHAHNRQRRPDRQTSLDHVCIKCSAAKFVDFTIYFHKNIIFTAWSSDENSVCLSNGWFVTKRKNVVPASYTTRKIIYPSFVTRRMVGGGNPFYLKFWVKQVPLEKIANFELIFTRPSSNT